MVAISPDLLVPAGLTAAGELVKPTEAVKGLVYLCPVCRSELIIRRGPINRPHFAHRAEFTCSSESILHQTAKLMIAQAIKGDELPVIRRICAECHQIYKQPLPRDRVDQVKLEYPFRGFVLDLALLNRGEVVAAIEINVTHGIGGRKAQDLRIPFLELSGQDVVDQPLTWYPLIDRFLPGHCPKCQRKKRLAKAAGIVPTGEAYRRLSVHKCKCGADLLLIAGEWVNREGNRCPDCGASFGLKRVIKVVEDRPEPI